MWPRFRLTPDESKYSSKYENPHIKQNAVLRRIYYGFLNITPTIRQDTETFQIARRSRIFALTASGDIGLLEIQIIDITGEQYTTDFTPLAGLLGGSNSDPRGNELFTNPTPPNFYNTGYVQNNPMTYSPLIFEPNIVLMPNQTININARPIDPTILSNIHVSLCFHVVEFPGMPGSPS